MDIREVEKTVPEVTAGRGSPMLKGNVKRGMVGIQPRSEEKMTCATVGGEPGRTRSRIRSGKTAESAPGKRLTNVPELTHLGSGIDIFA